MNELCRLCLTAADQNMHDFTEDNSVLNKINTCLRVTIIIDKLLPNQICKECIAKVEDINKYYIKVTETENLLQEFLQKGNFKCVTKFKDKNIKKEIEIVYDYDDYDDAKSPKVEDIDSELLKEKTNVQNNSPNKDLENLNIDSGDESQATIKKHKELTKPCKSNNQNKGHDPSKNKAHDPFKCLMCFGILDSQTNLYRHYKKEHYSNGKTDGECLTVYTDNGVAYKCSICGKEYTKKMSTVRHLVVHTDDRPFYCNLCGRTYKTIQQIIEHGKVHSGFKLLCKFGCGYTSAYRGALKEHERRHNKAAEYKYKCEKCGKGFEVRTWYEQHQNVHKGVKPFVCDVCGLSFHMAKYLTNHRANVHPQSARIKKYMCTHCALPCASMSALTEHLKEHGIVKPSRYYLCDACGKTYTDAEQLKDHKNYVHLGIKPHKCSVCNKAFTKKFNLQVHERTHSGSRDFMCGCCGKRFSQQSSLKRHYCREHTGPDVCKCSKCEKTFKNRRQLATHLKICV